MNSPTAPFIPTGWAAILAGGLVAAAIAHAPSHELVWMVAYLVLVPGAAQCAIGRGLRCLPERAPNPSLAWGEWVLLNLGHAGIIAGTLSARFTLVAGATVVYWIALLWLGLQVRNAARRPGLLAYRALLVLLALAALVGVTLAAVSSLR